MTTLEIEIAIMKYLDFTKDIIVPNVTRNSGLVNHECDLLLLTKSNYAKEIEIKVDKYDLINDSKKTHGHIDNRIKDLYFAVPISLKEVALKNIPERAGLFIVDDRHNNTVGLFRTPTREHKPIKWTDKERSKLTRLGTMRIYSLKKRIQKMEGNYGK